LYSFRNRRRRQFEKKILEKASNCKKPVVVDFIGGDAKAILEAGAIPCVSLEDAARKAVAALRGEKNCPTLKAFDASGR